MIGAEFTCTRAWKPSSFFVPRRPFPLLQHCWSVSFLWLVLQIFFFFHIPFQWMGCVFCFHTDCAWVEKLCFLSFSLSFFFYCIILLLFITSMFLFLVLLSLFRHIWALGIYEPFLLILMGRSNLNPVWIFLLAATTRVFLSCCKYKCWTKEFLNKYLNNICLKKL